MTGSDPLPHVDPVTPVAATAAPEGDAEDGPHRRRPAQRRRLSQMLDEMASDDGRERISVADIVAAMPGRATAALLFLFAAPNAIPTPPGASAILGLPMIYLAFQLMLRRQPWLPRVLAERSMLRTDFARLVGRAVPWLERAERMLRPRLAVLVSPPGEVMIGALALVLALCVALPIPLGNMLPAFAVCLLALGVLERDGLWVIIGTVIGALSLVVVWGVVTAGVKLLIYVISSAFA